MSGAAAVPAGVPAAAPAVAVRGLSKTFPGQRALRDVSLDVMPADIHALLGHNGSGKSTLIKILAGIHPPDPGADVLVAGEPLPFASPRESRRMGLQFVHQALGIIEELTAVENIALGAGYRRRAGLLIDWPAQRAKTVRLLGKLEVEFDIDRPVAELRPVDRSAIAIARALDDDWGMPRALVLDEPTAALPPSEVESLFGLVRQVRAAGAAVIYVSHRLDEIFELAGSATVLRDGVSQGTVAVDSIDRRTLVHMIVGREMEDAELAAHVAGGGAAGPSAGLALRVTDLRSRRLRGVGLTVAEGEIVGVAGLTGSGREEMAGALVGAIPSRGAFEVAGAGHYRDPNPRTSMDHGVVLVLPSRSRGAASPDLSVRENLTLPTLNSYARSGFVRRRRERAATASWTRALDIRPRDPERAFALLSGGNQQKVVFSKWLNTGPKVLIVEDPTSGVDVGARRAIYDLVRERAATGLGVVVCSSDTEDLVGICDRVVVLGDGLVVEEITGDDITESRVLTAMLHSARDSTRDHQSKEAT